MNQRKKVLVLASWYPSRVNPFLGTFVQRHAEAAAMFAEIAVISVTNDPAIRNKYEIEAKKINGVLTVNVYYRQSPILFLKGWRYLNAYQKGWKYVLKRFGKPDLIHLNILWRAGLFALFLKKFYKIPYIISENWTGYLSSDGAYDQLEYAGKLLTKMIARNALLIMPVSHDLKRAMISHGLNSRYEIVYNVVDTEIFYPSDSNKSDKFTFLHVSTGLDEQKNVTGILQAVKMLSERNKNFKLNIVSETLFDAHARTAENLGILNSFVFFKSAKQHTGIAEEMRSAHCFVLFSNYENLPVVILEAMASGLPVISTMTGGVVEHISKDFGILVQPHSVKGLCDAMEKMIETISAYSPERIRSYAVTHFSYQSVGKRFQEIYNGI